MPRFVNFKDFKGQPIVVNADQVIYVRSFGSIGRTEIAFGAAQQNEALCIVVEGTVDSVVRELDGGVTAPPASVRSARAMRSSRPPVSDRARLMASRG